MLEQWIEVAKAAHASDLHVEPGLPLGLRAKGQLRMQGEPISAGVATQAARKLIGEAKWPEFQQRQSSDLSRTVAGVRCRFNVFRTARGIGMAVRLLTSFQATLKRLNLHPDLARLVQHTHGLILVSGPTGSGKSSTLAALIQEINMNETRHIVTVESPIEYTLAPKKSFIRQREVGRDTPSFEQALMDALREDPDVLMVGELRDAQTMRLTLNAAETGHLVLATVHSSSAGEACARIVSSFAPEIQNGVAAQLADALVAVVCQRLTGPAPELEILLGTTAAKSVIRQGAFSKLVTVLESGGQEGQWTFARYRQWLASKLDMYTGGDHDLAPDEAPIEVPELRPTPKKQVSLPGVIEIDDDADPAAILSELTK